MGVMFGVSKMPDSRRCLARKDSLCCRIRVRKVRGVFSSANIVSTFDSILPCHLESDRVAVVCGVPAHRNHGEDVDEGSAVPLEVDDLELNLIVGLNSLSHLLHCVLVHMLTRRLWANLASRGLEETTILAHNFLVGVASKQAEMLRSIDDGGVRLFEIAKKKGDGAVDGAESDLRVGPASNAKLDECQICGQGIDSGDGHAREYSSCRNHSEHRDRGT